MNDVDERVTDLSAAVTTQQTGLDEVATDTDEVRDRTATLEADVASVDTRLDDLETDVQESIDAVEAELADQK